MLKIIDLQEKLILKALLVIHLETEFSLQQIFFINDYQTMERYRCSYELIKIHGL